MQYAGDPIDCTNDLKSAADSMLDNYCWVKGLYVKKDFFFQSVICLKPQNDFNFTGTYTNKPDLNNPEQGQRGRIDHFCHPKFDENGKFLNNCWHHYYYQWVALVILCQAGCFYLPRYVTYYLGFDSCFSTSYRKQNSIIFIFPEHYGKTGNVERSKVLSMV